MWNFKKMNSQKQNKLVVARGGGWVGGMGEGGQRLQTSVYQINKFKMKILK